MLVGVPRSMKIDSGFRFFILETCILKLYSLTKGGETASTGILNLGGIPRSYRLVKQIGNNNRRQLRLRLGRLVGQHPVFLSCEEDKDVTQQDSLTERPVVGKAKPFTG